MRRSTIALNSEPNFTAAIFYPMQNHQYNDAN